MAKTDKRGRGEPMPTSPWQRSAGEAVGDDLPKQGAVQDPSVPAPGDQAEPPGPPAKRDQTKSRSSKGGEK